MAEGQAPEKAKPKFTREYVKLQIEQTIRDISNLEDRKQQNLGLLAYLQLLEKDFDLETAKPAEPQ